MISLFVCFLCMPSFVSGSVHAALEVCAANLIPSLFPFIVLAGIMNTTGFMARLSARFGKSLGHLLGIRSESMYAVIMGSVGGFPIGAVCVRDLYESGHISKNEAERLLALSSNASPAFCISALGVSLFSDIAVGIKLYVCQLAAMIVIGLFLRKKRCSVSYASINSQKMRLSDAVTEAVATGGITMLKICSFAVFFAVLGDIVCTAVSHISGTVSAAVCASLCELTLAGRYALLLDGKMRAVLAAFAVGWSGLSVHMQTAAVLSSSSISLSLFRRAKLMQGIISAALMCVFT